MRVVQAGGCTHQSRSTDFADLNSTRRVLRMNLASAARSHPRHEKIEEGMYNSMYEASESPINILNVQPNTFCSAGKKMSSSARNNETWWVTGWSSPGHPSKARVKVSKMIELLVCRTYQNERIRMMAITSEIQCDKSDLCLEECVTKN